MSVSCLLNTEPIISLFIRRYKSWALINMSDSLLH